MNRKCIWKIERRKLFHTKTFWFSLILGILIVSLNSLYMINPSVDEERELLMQESEVLINPVIYSYTLFNTWIGNEAETLAFSIYYFIFPILCLLPFGWSLGAEMQSGYLKNIAVRFLRKDYFTAKYVTAFLGGGLAGCIPLLVNFLVNAAFIPAIKPDLLYPYYLTLEADFMADFYSSHPLLFNLVFLVLAFFYFGAIAGCGTVCAFLVKNKAMTIILPAGVLYLVHYFSSLLPYPQIYYDVSPLYCIHPTAVRYHSSGLVLFGYMGCFLLFAAIVLKAKGNQKYEIL